ncbi:DnaD domain protein [Lacrimispora defluvii]|uniref:DnaD domain protein n=1 Tax=Lacrimispora defluvii TaxID=2719233 RepID=A0ABX1VRD4_9FIRM|nr:DnaD domain protein [Lacrimispora defluvii]NNJ30985.1 DnaD domain protein [Lacrimispora defluvii]
MAVNFKSSFKVNGTIISNQFIDDFMASANGEYIKEYLFLMRHEGEEVTVSTIADALNHTEADVARALSYWKKAGVLSEEAVSKPEVSSAVSETACSGRPAEAVKKEISVPSAGRKSYTPDQISGLAGDEDFSQLLYIAQKYMNKVFTQRECEVFAYLYDGLHMPAELLEYVVEYCVQGGHTSIRYIETVAISWHEKGFKTVDDAKNNALTFSKDSFAVMRAFGLSDRNPGDSEREYMDKWFRTYGFTKELVMEACSRTLTATHSPSFPYTDKIIEGWKKAGARTMEDIRKLDEQHADRKKSGGDKGTKAASGAKGKNGQNQFQNFPQREIDYDALILEQLTEFK